MRSHYLFSIILLLLAHHCSSNEIPKQQYEEEDAAKFLNDLNEQLIQKRNYQTIAEWAFASNITDENEKLKNDVAAEVAKYHKQKATEIRKFDYTNYKDEELKRQLKFLSDLGAAALDDADFAELQDALSKMEGNYAKVKLCSYTDRTKCNLALEPEVEEVITKSRNPDELKYYWKEWYDKAGTPVRGFFDKYIALTKKAANLNNYTSGAEYWLSKYEDDTFEEQLQKILTELRPFYEQIHAYVRWRLHKFYGPEIVSEKGPIPIHLLGNLWGQSWEDISDIVQPYEGKAQIDVTDEMVKQGYTPLKMFQMGDEFFQSLNMTKLPNLFWENSILEKPTDGRELICHASAWDFFKKDDVRIKQCTRVTMDQLFTVHHELGHIQYFLQYQHLPYAFRDGANPGFHEAVGDVLSLSVSTPKHLEKIGLLKNYELDKETIINVLFTRAISKIVFLPFAYTLDKYRWGVFRGEIKPEEYNCAFWKLRDQYSGVEPPVQRSETDFDPPAKYHISADVEYLRYFVSFIVQFQFYKTACEKAGQYEPGNPELPLYNCDIFGSTDAGNAFKQLLSLGASKPWPDAMEIFTGERKMSGNAMLEYFEPLRSWLEEENKKNGVFIGWESSTKCG